MEQWTKEKAWEWYNKQPWIRGFNGYPSNCVNRVAMWQSYKHKEVFEQIEEEFKLAKETGFNAVRTIIQFEVWLYEHDSFMNNLEEYFVLADKYGLEVMLVTGNDCCVPKDFYSFKLGEQKVDWGYHSGIKRGQHSNTHNSSIGYQLNDEDEYKEKYYQMVDEIAAKYSKDNRLQIWNVWNEIGNGQRKTLSVPMMEKCFEIIRSHDPIQPLTAEMWILDESYDYVRDSWQKRAVDLSDVVSFHCYSPSPKTQKYLDFLDKNYGRPILNTEWLHRIEHNNVEDVFPLMYEKKVGCYLWGLIAGFSQTYEPWGCYDKFIKDPNYDGPLDLTKWQHDLYRFNGMPYIAKEVEIIKHYSKLADEEFYK